MRQRISASTRQFLEKTKATELVGEAEEKRLLSSVSSTPANSPGDSARTAASC